MTEDAEAQLYRDIANLTEQLPKLDKRIKKLESHCRQLSTKINRIEIQGLQDQFTSLTDNILQIKRTLARFEMDFTQSHMIDAIRISLSGSIKQRAEDHIKLEFARSAEALKHTMEPLFIGLKFRKNCIKFSEANNLDAFYG